MWVTTRKKKQFGFNCAVFLTEIEILLYKMSQLSGYDVLLFIFLLLDT